MIKSRGRKSRKRLRSSSPSSSSKFQITDLPNCLIQQILGFLPLKDAIKFCTLSRQWDSLWKSISNISFHCRSYNLNEAMRFSSFVDKALMSCDSTKIKNLSLRICPWDLVGKAVSLLGSAMSHKVEEFCLEFAADVCIFTRFDLGRILERGNCFPSLKIFSLTKTSYKSETIREILLRSPLIESLTLRECLLSDKGTGTIDASGTSLKELVIDGCRGSYYRQIKISAPNLLSLTVVGYFGKIIPNLVDVSSLKEATINLKRKMNETNTVPAYSDKEMLKGLLEKLIHVDKLAIGIESLQVLSIMRLNGEVIPTSRCKTLKVEMELLKSFLPGMDSLLDSSPYLEQLTMYLSHRARSIRRTKESVDENYWRSEARIFSCLNENLRRVEVVGSVPANPKWKRNQILVETMHFLLDNAKVLQKLIVRARNRNRLIEIKEKILSHPRASPNAQVEFLFPNAS